MFLKKQHSKIPALTLFLENEKRQKKQEQNENFWGNPSLQAAIDKLRFGRASAWKETGLFFPKHRPPAKEGENFSSGKGVIHVFHRDIHNFGSRSLKCAVFTATTAEEMRERLSTSPVEEQGMIFWSPKNTQDFPQFLGPKILPFLLHLFCLKKERKKRNGESPANPNRMTCKALCDSIK